MVEGKKKNKSKRSRSSGPLGPLLFVLSRNCLLVFVCSVLQNSCCLVQVCWELVGNTTASLGTVMRDTCVNVPSFYYSKALGWRHAHKENPELQNVCLEMAKL